MMWPKWIPYPGQFLRAFGLMMGMVPIIFLAFFLLPWAIQTSVFEAEPLTIGLMTLWFFFSLIGLTAWGHHQFFGPDDKKRIQPASWWAATFAVLCLILMLLWVGFSSASQGSFSHRHTEEKAFYAYLLLSYACQLEYLARHRLAKPSAGSTRPKAAR